MVRRFHEFVKYFNWFDEQTIIRIDKKKNSLNLCMLFVSSVFSYLFFTSFVLAVLARWLARSYVPSLTNTHSLDTHTYSIIEYSTGYKNPPCSYRIQRSLVNIEKDERRRESEKAIERIFENVRMYAVFPFCRSVYTRLSGVWLCAIALSASAYINHFT